MRSVQPGLMALAVAVVVGTVEVELRTGKFILSTGDSRVFAAEPSEKLAQKEKSVKSAPLPSGVQTGRRRTPYSTMRRSARRTSSSRLQT